MRLELENQRNPYSGILQVIQVPRLAEVKKKRDRESGNGEQRRGRTETGGEKHRGRKLCLEENKVRNLS